MALKTKTAADYGTDLLVLDIADQLDKCCDEVRGGCDRCPVRVKCKRLWGEIENCQHLFKIREYRIFCQNLYNLKRERNEILSREASYIKRVS